MAKNKKILNLKSPTELSGFYLVYKGSVLNEHEGVRGLSHLGEHLFCKAFDHLLEELDSNDIGWNAYTSDDAVVFYFTGLEERVAKYRDVIVDLMSKFVVSEEQFLNEKKIVIEEYKDAFNDQVYHHAANLERKRLNDYNAIGELGDLQNLTYQDCLDFFKVQYSHPTMIINVSKDFVYNSNIEFAEPTPKLNIPIKFVDNKNYIHQKSNDFKDKTSIIYMSDVVIEDFAAVKFLTSMIGYGLKSPLYYELREKRGLVYYVRCSLDNKNDVSGYININAITSNGNVEVFMKTLDDLLAHPEAFLTQERFDIIRDMYYVQFKKKAINRYSNITEYLSPDEWNIEYALDSFTLDEMKVVYEKYFTNWYKSVDREEFKDYMK